VEDRLIPPKTPARTASVTSSPVSTQRAPNEPPSSDFAFPPVSVADEHGRVAVGGDLEPGTLLLAYRSGLFPMRSSQNDLTWWSPDPRGILPIDSLKVSRSLKKSAKRYGTTVDLAFEEVIAACAHRPEDEYPWITDEVREAYVRLHDLGWAHSVETWVSDADGLNRELVGGLYGVAIGGMFAGESMFSRRSDASKVALVALVEVLRGDGSDSSDRILDVQWVTPHLTSLGAIPVPRKDYLARLDRALRLPLPETFGGRAPTD
jgi:leucyl/phenylalanyl-tRNA---protein transferase